MVELRYGAGNIFNKDVHKIGIIALGSHLENHGPALPIDTDAKIAAYIAFQASLESGAKFLGIIYPAHEIEEINHGIHYSLNELAENIIKTLKSAKKYLNIEKVIIVNAHGGNIPLFQCLDKIESEIPLDIVIINNTVIENEGPHGGSGEISMGKVLGILNEDELNNQSNIKVFGEVGLSEFKEARKKDPGIEEGAKEIEDNGVYLDVSYGKQILNLAVNSVLLDVEKLLDY
ncbi:MAG: 2-amino-5-formylamino-6-ribosylaminopyrimidin-4(3H)-one 5'-monophosphate deformylase [Methanobrevibacter arboriphilus]|jgi:2-amino-5-formylamino-6-ribosylaminopyrimidin-4(3H)-one 5'-monophosphate deformylase|uniref:2-amino-5-formylamino-6-ribosylaminopyrimidin-4(3H)-one 5'-monophosphate deformylase n=2 Tax=Methanobrevibacter arboriphilus TaxID=39441 RepID=A0A843AJL3_METAZ|nr:2-amino-5-formylamino-6-ribosylaminopyrimidin-4(3H)-one 5'-monophosphate deformylase [Methanobrevibacter arboriphilus]MBF4469235.1 2-amino-5-formylamino-6-ribosylaminopyrimidin-4(3H)-one 5'-monophosphate deformylase [Methanobrevibacter arboriphilus]MCC7562501.1 2-amino-5-formylamino-6-ribosylaminopyrimidin-4(3H)-one 5'-monophosphate deformylase [Methanobrevibacter arboriphilus]BBL61227.1 2-amino-5-formylamino-6-ribosylaminopyrimidin-4(3H)-one 5'-monophosphate deformylase [Methanobrevibacter a